MVQLRFLNTNPGSVQDQLEEKMWLEVEEKIHLTHPWVEIFRRNQGTIYQTGRGATVIGMQLTDTGMNNIMMLAISAVAIMARGVMFPCALYLLPLILMLGTIPIHTQEDQNMILLDGTGPSYTQEELDILLVDGRVLLIVQQDQREHIIQGMRTAFPLMDMMNMAISCTVHTVQWDLLLLL